MNEPIPGGDDWAQAVVEGATEGEHGHVAGSSSGSSIEDDPAASAPANEETELEIVELDDLDPSTEATDAEVLDGEQYPEEPAESANGDQVSDDGEPEPAEGGDPSDGSDNQQAAVGAEVTVEDLVNDLERVSAERDQYLDASRRLQAEFENYKKQVSKRETTARERANDGLIAELLPILDAFDGAVANGADDVAPMRTTMLDALAKQGLDRIDPAEGSFDPTLHEAVMHEDGDEAEGPVVAEVLRAGYLWKGRVLRPAMVKTRG